MQSLHSVELTQVRHGLWHEEHLRVRLLAYVPIGQADASIQLELERK